MTKEEFRTFIHATHTRPKVLTVDGHSFNFHPRPHGVLVSACKDGGLWYCIGAITGDVFDLKTSIYPVGPSQAKLDWILRQDAFECAVKTVSHRQTKYHVKREPVRLRGGPFDGATVWLDDAGSARNTAPFRVGEHYGLYRDKQWSAL